MKDEIILVQMPFEPVISSIRGFFDGISGSVHDMFSDPVSFIFIALLLFTFLLGAARYFSTHSDLPRKKRI